MQGQGRSKRKDKIFFVPKVKVKARKELEFSNLKVTSKGVEGLCSPNLVVACKLEDEEGGGDKVRIAYIDRLYNFKYKRFLFYLWIQKAKIPNYEATSLKRGMF